MRFKKISFNNYRCFLNGELSFDETNEKNINLIIGPNGGGKTEMLFAFWWTLYEFDFTTLQGKENTPYALNSDLYKKLKESEVGAEKECSVVIEFEHMDVTYRVKKKCVYRKTAQQIRLEPYQEFSHYLPTGELSLPTRDPREIDKQINKIIPKAILDGIIFDGERMQKLSSADEKSKKAIQGVINDITNVELIENCILNFRDIRKDLNSQIRKMATQTKQTNLDEVIGKISEDDQLIESDKCDITEKSERLEIISQRLGNISDELKSIEGAKILETQRTEERKKVESNNKLLDEYYKDFSASLKDGYLLDTGKLLDTVEDIIQRIDVPVGLTVEAVKSIISRPQCICGKCLDQEALNTLNELILSLPPDNINSTLAEVIRQMREKIKDVRESCRRNYDYINRVEKEIKESKERISSLSAQILGFDAEKAQELERENTALSKEKLQLEFDIERLKREIKEKTVEREVLIEQRDSMGKNNEETSRLNKQLDFVEKCLKAFDLIKDKNKEKALTVINEKFEMAYSVLSEDSKLGNSIYVVQYDESAKYQMIVYIHNKVIELLNRWKQDGSYEKKIQEGMSENEIREMAILANADSNSTGQSKMNTLAFAKAILDYSNEQKDENGVEIQKEYPFLIDAPFGDIAGENLVNASSELHTFSNQILLMLDKDKYEGVRPYLSAYVNKIYRLEKNSEQNVTDIVEEAL